MTVLTVQMDNPEGYGRIIRGRGQYNRIVEHRTRIPTRENPEINSGIYCFDRERLSGHRQHQNDNAQGEYYLTDIVEF